jgi:hypothetical protein
VDDTVTVVVWPLRDTEEGEGEVLVGSGRVANVDDDEDVRSGTVGVVGLDLLLDPRRRSA